MESPDNGGRQDEAELLERVHASARALARQLVKSKHKAEDIAQDVTLEVLTRLRSGAEVKPERLDGYVATIVLRRSSDMRLRRRRAAARDWVFLSEISANRRTWMNPEAQLNERELAALYERTRDSLPYRCRQAFIFVREQEQSYADAARRLGVSEKMIAKFITQAQRVFRTELRARGVRVPREKRTSPPMAFVSRPPSTSNDALVAPLPATIFRDPETTRWPGTVTEAAQKGGGEGR